jgi:hypothetical protein
MSAASASLPPLDVEHPFLWALVRSTLEAQRKKELAERIEHAKWHAEEPLKYTLHLYLLEPLMAEASKKGLSSLVVSAFMLPEPLKTLSGYGRCSEGRSCKERHPMQVAMMQKWPHVECVVSEHQVTVNWAALVNAARGMEAEAAPAV